jgi:hypothetical protein
MSALVLISALIIGLSVGLLGSGGSILTVPVLVHLVQLPEKVAIVSSLGVVAQISFIALLPYLWRRHLDFDLFKRFAVPAFFGTLLGVALAQWLHSSAQLLILAVLMLGSAANMWRRTIWQWQIHSSVLLAVLAMSLGLLTGLVGVGGGFLIVPLLLAVTAIPMSAAIACSLALIFLQSSTGFVSHYWLMSLQGQSLPLALISWVGLIGACGSLLGIVLSAYIPQLWVRKIFSVLLMGTVVSLLWPLMR